MPKAKNSNVRSVFTFKIHEHGKTLLSNMAIKHRVSMATIIRAGILLFKMLVDDPEKLYNAIDSCLWVDIKTFGNVSVKECVKKTLVKKLIDEAERL